MLVLKELQSYKENFFVFVTKIGHSKRVKLLIFKIKLDSGTSNLISAFRKLNLLHKLYLFGLLFSRNSKKTHAD